MVGGREKKHEGELERTDLKKGGTSRRFRKL